MSTEQPRLKNFTGLEGLEELLRKFQLVVNQGYGQIYELEVGSSISLSYADIREVGLSVRTNASKIDLLQAVGEARLEAEDVDLIVVAEGSFLKDREVIARLNVKDAGELIHLCNWRSLRGDALRDKRHGFRLEVCAILNRELPAVPLRPRRLGTILAKETFGVVPNKLGTGLVPLPLTQKVVDESSGLIPKGTVFWVEVKADLFDVETIDEAITVYIDEEIHTQLGLRRTPDAKLLQQQFAMDTLAQLILLASIELSGKDISENDERSIVGQFLFQLISKTNPKKYDSARSVLTLIKNQPTAASAMLTTQFKYKEQIRKLLFESEDPT